MEGKQDRSSARGGETPAQSYVGFAEWVPLRSGIEPGDKQCPHHQDGAQHCLRGCFSLEDRPQGTRRKAGLGRSWFNAPAAPC